MIVTGPGGQVLDATSPVKYASFASVLDGTYENPLNPQPPPGNTNYRCGPWSTVLSLAGTPAGTYSVHTMITNKVRSSGAGQTLACTTGTPTGAAGLSAYTPGIVTRR